MHTTWLDEILARRGGTAGLVAAAAETSAEPDEAARLAAGDPAAVAEAERLAALEALSHGGRPDVAGLDTELRNVKGMLEL